MAIVYPLSLPTNYGMSNISLGFENVGAISQSPFTFNQQVIKHAGERWLATVSLPPMKRDDSEPWIAMLMSLRGTYGTFLMGDPNAKNPQGDVVQRNLYQYSEDFSNAYWAKSNLTVTATGDTNPVSGFNTGVYNLVENTAVGAAHSVIRNISLVAGEPYTESIYISSASTRQVVILYGGAAFGGTFQTVQFNPATGLATIVSGTPTVKVTSETSGWYRLAFMVFPTVTNTESIQLYLNNGSTNTYTGDGVSFAKITDRQIENAMSASTYQKILGAFGPDVLVNGGSQTGSSLIVDNLNWSVTDIIKAGDYIQLGTGSGASLHKVLQNSSSDASGNATLDIWPSLRSSPANNAVVKFKNTVGRFRLAQNLQTFEINNISSYGITFDCIEAL